MIIEQYKCNLILRKIKVAEQKSGYFYGAEAYTSINSESYL